MKKLVLISFTFIFMLLLQSCGGAIENRENDYIVDEQYDKFDNVHMNIMRENILDGGYAGVGVVHASSLNIRQDVYPDKTIYYFVLVCVNNDWLFIGEGNSLTLLVDGEKIELVTFGSVNQETVSVGKDVYCKEKAHYLVEKELILKMANAKSIDLKITGSNVFVERKFNKSNFSNFKRFIKDYIK